MATLLKNPQKTRQRRKRQGSYKTQVKAGQRLKRRLLYIIEHPLNFLWGWLSAVRTAIFLIASISVVCFIGIYFIQAPAEVLGDSVAYSAWLEQSAFPRYGAMTPIYDWLQFFTIFSSWYFLLLLAVLSVSIVVCTLNRAPAIWQNFAHPLMRRNENFYVNALERSKFSHANAVEWTRGAFRNRHYRLRSVVEDCRSGPGNRPQRVTYLYANKNSWATLATFVFHAALVTLLMAGVLSQWHGFPQNSPARRFLPAPLLSLSGSLAGFTFEQALPNGESAVVYPRGTPHNISFRANSFTAKYDPKTGLPTDYVTDLSVYRDGELVAHSDHLRVNDPLAYDGIVFHQSSLIPSANITITDKQGNVLYNDAVVLDQSTSISSSLMVDYAKGIPLADPQLTLGVFFLHEPSIQLPQVQNPSLLITVGKPNTDLTQDKVVVRLKSGQSGQSVDKEWTVRLNSVSEATVLLVTKDAGAPFIWPTAVILILSLCVTFYFPQRRIWIRIEGEQVQMAALREHFTNIRTDLIGIAREATER